MIKTYSVLTSYYSLQGYTVSAQDTVTIKKTSISFTPGNYLSFMSPHENSYVKVLYIAQHCLGVVKMYSQAMKLVEMMY